MVRQMPATVRQMPAGPPGAGPATCG